MLSNNFGSCVEIALNLHFPFNVWIAPYIGNQKTEETRIFVKGQSLIINYKRFKVICGFSPY